MTYTSEVLADSPLVYWRAGESSGNLADSGSAGIAGVVSGTNTRAVTGLVGDADNAIQLSGGIITGTPAGSRTGSFTVEMVHKPSGSFATNKLIGTRDSAEWGFDLQISSTGLHADIGDGGVWLSTTADVSYTFSLGTVYHLALVVDATAHTYTYYVNGSSIGSGSISSGTPLVYNTSHKIFVADNGRAEGSQQGVYDEIAIYGTALSGARIAAHYAAMPSPISVTVPSAMAVTLAMVSAPTLRIDLGVAVPAPMAFTVAMHAPAVKLTSRFAAYDLDANASQAMQIPVQLTGSLYADPVPVLPVSHWTEAQIRARRLSLVMPTPTLDSRGRPT